MILLARAVRGALPACAVALAAAACSDPVEATGPSADVASAAGDALLDPDGVATSDPSPAALRDHAAFLREVPAGAFDPLSVPMGNGVVWYGTWEDAVAEVRRTGKPLMLHMGSPRCPNGTVCVPGTW